MPAFKAGDKCGALTLDRIAGRSPDGHLLWLCKCECGGEALKGTGSLRTSLRTGCTPSCGCIARESSRLAATTHGMKSSPTYSSWHSAKHRCGNPRVKDYPAYGGRGISMCPEWRDSFEAFLRDMGEKPEGTTLDRIDNNGNYEPGNCRWATVFEQVRNRRVSVYVSWQGKPAHLSEVAEALGITYGAAYMRLKRGKLYDGHPV